MKARPIPLAFALLIAAESNFETVATTERLNPGALASMIGRAAEDDPGISSKRRDPSALQILSQFLNFPNFPNFANFYNCFTGNWRNC